MRKKNYKEAKEILETERTNMMNAEKIVEKKPTILKKNQQQLTYRKSNNEKKQKEKNSYCVYLTINRVCFVCQLCLPLFDLIFTFYFTVLYAI